jgi:hypothetical protein
MKFLPIHGTRPFSHLIPHKETSAAGTESLYNIGLQTDLRAGMEEHVVLCVTFNAKRFVLSIVSLGKAACSCSNFTRSMCMFAVVTLGNIAPCVSNKQ